MMLMNRYELRIIIYRMLSRFITPQPFYVVLIIIKIIRIHAMFAIAGDVDDIKCMR